MAVLGKRKASEPSSVSQDDAEEIFRRHFEAQFAPIEPSASKRRAGSQDEDDNDDSTAAGTAGRRRQGISDNGNDEESEWGGFSEDDREDGAEDSDDEDAEDGDQAAIQVVDHSTSQTPKPAAMSKRELKAFMSSRPPDQAATKSKPSAATSTQSSSTTLPEDAPSLLAQDLELRRLISESHLLTSAKPSTSSSSASFFSSGLLNEPKLFTNGRIRQKATDMRVQALGSKDSILTQKSMPMNMRKGIVAAATAKETKRRKEARENGVILERENKSKGKARKSGRSRDMGIDMPGMGRFRGAELKLNDREVQRIEGSRDVFGRRNGGRRR